MYFMQIKVHVVGSEDIFNYVTRNMLPAEIGGTGPSVNQLNGNNYST